VPEISAKDVFRQGLARRREAQKRPVHFWVASVTEAELCRPPRDRALRSLPPLPGPHCYHRATP
jgi:hypothetical protein